MAIIKDKIMQWVLTELNKRINRSIEELEIIIQNKAKVKFPNVTEKELLKLIRKAISQAQKLTYKQRIDKLKKLKDKAKKEGQKQLRTELLKPSAAEQYIKQLHANKKISELASELTQRKVRRLNLRFKANSGTLDGSRIKSSYRAIFGRIKLKQDTGLMDLIIKHRKEIQNRMSYEVKLYSKGGVVAQLKVYEILLENGTSVVNYWTGLTIDPSSFPGQVQQFQGYLSQWNIKEVRILQAPLKKATITHVGTNFVFA